MAGGGLYDPLGTDRPQRKFRRGPSFSVIALVGVLIGLASLFAMAAFRDDGGRGEPRAIAKIGPVRQSEPAPPLSQSLASTGSPVPPSSAPGRSAPSSDQDVEIQNGVRVIRLHRNGATGGSLVMKVPDPTTTAVTAPMADAGLLEPGPSGPLPKVGIDGRTPAEAYAGAPGVESRGKPWVSIVVEPLGSDPAMPVSPDWPAAVTLGFGVEGTDLPQQVGGARAAGHEIVLVLPSRKARTLDPTASSVKGSRAPPAQDRLLSLLSRFTGYAGVMVDTANQDGTSLVSDIEAVARRGLYVVDEFPATTAVPATTDHADPLPMTSADLVLGGPAETEALERFGDRLAALARANSSAIGIMRAAPRSSAALARLITTLADRGTALVPLSAVVTRRHNAQARPLSFAAP